MSTKKSPERKESNKIRYEIIARDGYKCVICGFTQLLEVHHMHALYLGGNSNPDNLVTLCQECHKFAPETGRGDFEKFVADRNNQIYDALMKSPSSFGTILTAYKRFIKERLGEYVSNGIITEDQKGKILDYEVDKFF